MSCVKFWLSCDAEGEKVLSAVRAAGYSVETRVIADEDWENNWKQYYKPLPIGEKARRRPRVGGSDPRTDAWRAARSGPHLRHRRPRHDAHVSGEPWKRSPRRTSACSISAAVAAFSPSARSCSAP